MKNLISSSEGVVASISLSYYWPAGALAKWLARFTPRTLFRLRPSIIPDLMVPRAPELSLDVGEVLYRRPLQISSPHVHHHKGTPACKGPNQFDRRHRVGTMAANREPTWWSYCNRRSDRRAREGWDRCSPSLAGQSQRPRRTGCCCP